jgi:peptidoglycan L-alanyl-D-glutamate endopeptidase CwlK
MDKVTETRINLLHPQIRDEVKTLVEQANKVISPKLTIRIVQGLRTIEEQNDLYAQGRTKPGKVVTNAKGGSSYHNYGLAIDFAFLVDGKEISWDTSKDWDNDKIADWLEVVKIFVKAGYTWGGDFKSIKDMPHLEKKFGFTWQQLLEKYNKKDFVAGTKYVNLK